MNKAIEFDTREFDRKFGRLVDKAAPEAIRAGLAAAMTQLMNDAIESEPAAPVLTSALIGSASVFVNNKYITGSSEAQVKRVAALSSAGMFRGTTRGQQIVAEDYSTKRITDAKERHVEQGILVFNAPYAHYQHETNRTHARFLSAKILGNPQKYLRTFLDTMRKEMRRRT